VISTSVTRLPTFRRTVLHGLSCVISLLLFNSSVVALNCYARLEDVAFDSVIPTTLMTRMPLVAYGEVTVVCAGGTGRSVVPFSVNFLPIRMSEHGNATGLLYSGERSVSYQLAIANNGTGTVTLNSLGNGSSRLRVRLAGDSAAFLNAPPGTYVDSPRLELKY